MDTQVFAEWFKILTDKVKERPLLLLFDGHLTHISIPVIREALNQHIVILKFPPHVTDVLQPLDVTCFGPLKKKWEKLLHERINTFGAKHQLTKSDFVNQICKVWKLGMNKENIINGFESTGNIYGNIYANISQMTFTCSTFKLIETIEQGEETVKSRSFI